YVNAYVVFRRNQSLRWNKGDLCSFRANDRIEEGIVILGKLVLKLGDGSGHFTGELAKKACKVITLDSAKSMVKENENINGQYENVEFMCADVTSPNLNFTVQTVELILRHALLSNLSDIEVNGYSFSLIYVIEKFGSEHLSRFTM
nr:phosphomethylethanolamine N-methyltransferase-like isoform X2 [Tanacetum cinerariifolium]